MNKCQKIRYKNRSGNNTYVLYVKPLKKNDFKRYGKYMDISSNGFDVRFNGRQINLLKKTLRAVGEIGGRVDKKKCDIF